MADYFITARGRDEETRKAKEYLQHNPLNGEKLAECYKRLVRQEAAKLKRQRGHK